MNQPHEPTDDQCNSHVQVYEDEEKLGYAIWYPQMGGHVGKAVAVLDREWTEYSHGSRQGGCIDVYVWHNGEFPFRGNETSAKPAIIHHCDPEQFILFGQKLHKLNTLHRYMGGLTSTDPEPKKEVRDEFYEILDQMKEVHAKKAADYGSRKRQDPLINFRAGVPYGVPAWLYALIRVHEKLVRVQSFVENGELVNEGMDETLIDCANLIILSLQLYHQQIAQELPPCTSQ